MLRLLSHGRCEGVCAMLRLLGHSRCKGVCAVLRLLSHSRLRLSEHGGAREGSSFDFSGLQYVPVHASQSNLEDDRDIRFITECLIPRLYRHQPRGVSA